MGKARRRSQWVRDEDKVATAELVLRESRRLSRDPERLFRTIAAGKPVKLPRRSEMGVIASAFESLRRGNYPKSLPHPEIEVLRTLVTFCRLESDLLTDQGSTHYASALLALSAHRKDWVVAGREQSAAHPSSRYGFLSL